MSELSGAGLASVISSVADAGSALFNMVGTIAKSSAEVK